MIHQRRPCPVWPEVARSPDRLELTWTVSSPGHLSLQPQPGPAAPTHRNTVNTSPHLVQAARASVTNEIISCSTGNEQFNLSKKMCKADSNVEQIFLRNVLNEIYQRVSLIYRINHIGDYKTLLHFNTLN